MKYLITGSAGFVARYLVDAIRRAEPSADIIGVDRADLDLADFSAVGELIARAQPDRLVHLASFSSVGLSWREPVTSFTNNTNIFLNVLEHVRRSSPHARVLSIGSSEQYGRVEPSDLPLRETAPMRPLSPYAVARVAQEHLGDVYVRGYGVDVVATRSFNHVGPGQSDRFVISALARQFAELAHGKRDRIRVGTTSVIRDFLDVRDVVAAYLALLERGARGEVYNICSGRGIRITDAIAIFAGFAGGAPVIETDPELLRPVENEVVIGDHTKLTDAVGWRPTIPLETSLRAVYDAWLATA
jgi:GDP-4-dehydro-6-deoxy-D-mannose reductase